MGDSRAALVVGASRGIGRACARHLAAAGFDVALAARTLREGEGVGRLPGSLETVADEVRRAGRSAVMCQLDLLDRGSCQRAVEGAMGAFGRIDVLVNSGIFYPPSGMATFADTPFDEYDQAFAANVLAPLFMAHQVIPAMRERGGGLIVNISSGAGQNETAAIPGAGGWPLSYSITKAAINRAAAGLAKELRRDGIAVVNLEPGVVATERMTAVTMRAGMEDLSAVSVDVPGAVCAYLAEHPTPMAFSGRTVDAPQFSVWARIVEGRELPYPYGPQAWGAPPVVPIAGATVGIESAVPRQPPD